MSSRKSIKEFEFKSLASFDECFKIAIIGDSKVGKSCLIQKIQNDSFQEDYEPTMGFEFKTISTKIKDKILKFQIWDTSGNHLYQEVTKGILKDCSLIILVYDITNKQSFQNIDSWLKEEEESQTYLDNIILVGNKTDLEAKREVPKEYGEKKRDSEEIIKSFFECSAKNGENVKNIFIEIAKNLDVIEDKYENMNNLNNDEGLDADLSKNETELKTEKRKINANNCFNCC